MIRIITEIEEGQLDGRHAFSIHTRIDGGHGSTEKEFGLAKAIADMMEGIMAKAKKAAKKSGMDLLKGSDLVYEGDGEEVEKTYSLADIQRIFFPNKSIKELLNIDSKGRDPFADQDKKEGEE